MNVKDSDIDKTNKLIKITGTKTDSSERIVPLLPQVESLQFPLPRISKSRFQIAIREASKKLGLVITAHSLRHTFATRCREAGVDLKTYSEWLGHKQTGITIDLYSAHTTKELFNKEAAKLKTCTPISTPLCTENGTKSDEKL
jgi:integrase